MNNDLPAFTVENKELARKLEQLQLEFLDLFTLHKEMVENESVILTSLYLAKLGHLQLELLEKQTEAARLKMKMHLIQAAINRNVQPDLKNIEYQLNVRLQDYYSRIEAKSAAVDEANKILSHLVSAEESLKIKEIFRVLCKRLHPDLNPNQTEEEKDLFIRVKAAYDLNRLSDLQSIFLFLDNSRPEKLTAIPGYEKKERIEYLEKSIFTLKDKIDKLNQSFPFTIKALINDEEYIIQKQEELRTQIKNAETEIDQFKNVINIMIDE